MLLLNNSVAMLVTAKAKATTAATSGRIIAQSQPFVINVLIGLRVWVNGFHLAIVANQEGMNSSGNSALLVNINGMVKKFMITIRVSWVLIMAPRARDMPESVKHKIIAVRIITITPRMPVVHCTPIRSATLSIKLACSPD